MLFAFLTPMDRASSTPPASYGVLIRDVTASARFIGRHFQRFITCFFTAGLKEPSSPKLSSDLWLSLFQTDQPLGTENIIQVNCKKEKTPSTLETTQLKDTSIKVSFSSPINTHKITGKESARCEGSDLKSTGKRRNLDLNTLRVRRSDPENDCQLSAPLNDNSSSLPLSSPSNYFLTKYDRTGSKLIAKAHKDQGNSSRVDKIGNVSNLSTVRCIPFPEDILDKQADKSVSTSLEMKAWRYPSLRFGHPKSDPNERKKVTPSNLKLSPVLAQKIENYLARSASSSLNLSPMHENIYSIHVAKPHNGIAQNDISPLTVLANIAVPAPHNCIYINGQRYQVMRLLGEGGSSKVFEAHDANFRLVAIKCVNLEKADKDICDSFLNEIEILQRLQSNDRVIKLYDHKYFAEEKKLFVVMERGDVDLSQLLSSSSRRGGITPEMVKFYWSEMLRAVSVIHCAGIIHSDLKPSNFLLVAGQLKLIDFGIASTIPADATSIIKDIGAGTLNYMSPEAFSSICEDNQQSRRVKIGVKSDVWSLGCILHHMVFGRTPFHHIQDPFKKGMAITNPNYKIEFPPHDDKLLVDVLRRCIVRDIRKRASISELLSHPYIVAKTTKIESLESLISSLSELSPSSMNKVSEAMKLLKDEKST